MFSIEIPLCDFDKIYQGTQSYRWIRVDQNKYVVIDGKKIVLIEQKKNKKLFICSEDEFFDYWYNYFDCGCDYQKILFDVRRFHKLINQYSFFFGFLIKENKRYRLVKNDLFQTMIYYALDENNRDQKFERFLHTFGEKKINSVGGLKITWYKFPDPDKIDLSYDCGLTSDEIRRFSNMLNEITNDKLESLKMDKYEDYVYESLKVIFNDEVWIKNVMFYALGFKDVFCINDKMKNLFKINKVKPDCFKKFDNIKGYLLELLKVKEKWD